LFIFTTVTAAQTLDPPLLPGQLYFKMANGCGLVITGIDPSNKKSIEEIQTYYSKYVWRDECRYGLAHGRGKIVEVGKENQNSTMQTVFAYGRTPFDSNYFGMSDGHGGFEVYYTVGKSTVMLPARPNPYGASWMASRTFVLSDQYATKAFTDVRYCNTAAKKLNGCNPRNPYEIYGVAIQKTNADEEFYLCPNPRTSAG